MLLHFQEIFVQYKMMLEISRENANEQTDLADNTFCNSSDLETSFAMFFLT